MRRREFLHGLGGIAGFAAYGGLVPLGFGEASAAGREKVLGMYIHQHWPYRHPYAARTWTLDDYRGYAKGMKQLGYNTFVIWPMLEIRPDPLTPSDKRDLDKISKVIDMLHDELGMRAMIALCPNIAADNAEALKAPFNRRHFFYCDRFVNPGDPAALKKMIDWREKLLRPLARADAVTIIDSDPGGYPGSNNAQFANLFEAHRRMLNRLRPGIELIYWMHVGWEAYCRYYETGHFTWGTPAASVDILTRIQKLDPSPWTVTIHTAEAPPNGTDLQLAKRFGLAKTSLAFNYGAIEGEPSYPMTNFGGDRAYRSGTKGAPGGVVGNAQTHCVQLPNTFAFACGATGKSLPGDPEYLQFAGKLIEKRGDTILAGWQALENSNSAHMRKVAAELDAASKGKAEPGALGGLLFGSPQRFLTDLAMELRVKAAYNDFVSAAESGGKLKQPLGKFADEAGAWQQRTGYQCAWGWPKMSESLKKVHSPEIDAVLGELSLDVEGGSRPALQRINDHFKLVETYTPRLIQAMKKAAGA